MYTYVIIDDEELIRKGTIKKLEILKDQVQCIGEAEEGGKGIRLIESLHPDFVVLDMQMPGIDGMELLPWLSDHYPEMPLIVISGYRNFDYIKQAISSNALEYLLKPFSREAIRDVTLKAIARIEDRSQIYDQIRNSEQEKEQAQYDYDIQLMNNLLLGYQLSDITLTSRKLSYITQNHRLYILACYFDRTISTEVIDNALCELGFEDLILYFPSPSNERLGLLVVFTPLQDAGRDDRSIDQVINTLFPQFTDLNLSPVIGVSDVHDSITELNKAYREAAAALNRQLLTKDAAECYYYKEETETLPIRWEKEDELLFRIEAGMDSETAALTEEFFDHCISIENCTLADVKYHCYLLSDQCRKILDEYMNTSESLKSSASMQNVVSHIFSLAELKDYYKQFFVNLAKMLKPTSVYAIDDVIEKIRIYINRNYQKNLAQDFLASLFYINRSYMSTLFKERTGQKFVDYLNQVRIEKSKELLKNTDKKMYQIAKSVGYDNVKYFFRVFKKMEKVTPEEYRNM